MKYSRNTVLLLIMPALCLAAASAHCAERLYKWIDADGNIQYSNRLPPEAAKVERREMNEQGRVLKVYRAAQTEEEIAEARRLAVLEEKRKERERKRAIHDRSLLATYSSIDDMRNVQQGKITMVESLVQLTHSRIASMQERLVVLTDDAARYERSGKALPFTLQQQIQNLREQIKYNRQFASDKEIEIEEIKGQFARDIRRYESLTDPQPQRASSRSPLEIAMANPDLQLDSNDRTLLAAYSSEEDLQFARNEELEALDRDIRTAFEQLESKQKKLTELSESASGYETAGKPVPATLVERMQSLDAELGQRTAVLADLRARRQQLDRQFTADIERYRVLTASN